jgi:hypothetical protein
VVRRVVSLGFEDLIVRPKRRFVFDLLDVANRIDEWHRGVVGRPHGFDAAVLGGERRVPEARLDNPAGLGFDPDEPVRLADGVGPGEETVEPLLGVIRLVENVRGLVLDSGLQSVE